MGILSNKIERDEVKPGDHIYSWRNAYIYAHHGSFSSPPIFSLLQLASILPCLHMNVWFFRIKPLFYGYVAIIVIFSLYVKLIIISLQILSICIVVLDSGSGIIFSPNYRRVNRYDYPLLSNFELGKGEIHFVCTIRGW